MNITKNESTLEMKDEGWRMKDERSKIKKVYDIKI
jgi:hypothetical protein